MENEQFAQNLLPSLLSLVNDSIPNVRITLARLLTQRVLPVGKPSALSVKNIFNKALQ